jgi:hypothetical protein
MKKVLIAAIVSIFINLSLSSQSLQIPGKPMAEIFTDFHYNLAGGTNTTGFNISRVQFGYNYFATENFSALVKLDIGKPEDLAAGSKERRYAFFREASVTYAKDKLNISFGITSTRLFEFQQKFIGKRYIADNFQSLNGYGHVADLGVNVDYKFSDKIEADLGLMNGKGYSNIQVDDNLKASAGITIVPFKALAIRSTFDIMKVSNLIQTTLICFVGFKNEIVTIGGEISYKSNLGLSKGYDAWGFSGTGALSLTKKIEFFARYDFSTSMVGPGEITQWNLAKDGKLLISGFQYTFNNYVKIAVDYQATFPTDGTKPFSDMFFINSVFKF